MIFTLGHTASYLSYFKNYPCPKKKGRTDDYVGGSVWVGYKDALNRCSEGFSVFGVEANWDKDTIPSREGNWHDLLVDAPLVFLD